MMHTRQRGLTMISWAIIIALVAIQGVAAMRIVPVYLDYFSVKKIMDELKESPSARGATPGQIQSTIEKSLSINSLYSLRGNSDAFSFQKVRDGLVMTLHYEARGPIYGNLEFVATFDYEVEIPNK